MLELTATDRFGLTGTTTVALDPRTVDFVLSSDPPGADVTLDGTTAPAPLETTVIDGSSHGVASVPTYNGMQWQGWSDGGAIAHEVTATAEQADLTATFSAAALPPPVTLPDGPPTPGSDPATCHSREATIVGTKSADVIAGTPGDDVIVGDGGDDKIKGHGGDDVICGGGGRDLIRGGVGADKLRGGVGADTLRGGPGEDDLDGGPGRDRCPHGRADKRLSCY